MGLYCTQSELLLFKGGLNVQILRLKENCPTKIQCFGHHGIKTINIHFCRAACLSPVGGLGLAGPGSGSMLCSIINLPAKLFCEDNSFFIYCATTAFPIEWELNVAVAVTFSVNSLLIQLPKTVHTDCTDIWVCVITAWSTQQALVFPCLPTSHTASLNNTVIHSLGAHISMCYCQKTDKKKPWKLLNECVYLREMQHRCCSFESKWP